MVSSDASWEEDPLNLLHFQKEINRVKIEEFKIVLGKNLEC